MKEEQVTKIFTVQNNKKDIIDTFFTFEGAYNFLEEESKKHFKEQKYSIQEIDKTCNSSVCTYKYLCNAGISTKVYYITNHEVK